jgi:hypothetical protein
MPTECTGIGRGILYPSSLVASVRTDLLSNVTRLDITELTSL